MTQNNFLDKTKPNTEDTQAGDYGTGDLQLNPPEIEGESRTNIANTYQGQKTGEITENAYPTPNNATDEESNAQPLDTTIFQKKYDKPSNMAIDFVKRSDEEKDLLFDENPPTNKEGLVSTVKFSDVSKNSSPTVKKLFAEYLKGNNNDWSTYRKTITDGDYGEVLAESLPEDEAYRRIQAISEEKEDGYSVGQVLGNAIKVVKLNALGELAKLERVSKDVSREDVVEQASKKVREKFKGSINPLFLERALVQFKNEVRLVDVKDDDWESKVEDYEQRREELANMNYVDKANDIIAQVSRSFNPSIKDLFTPEDISKTAYSLLTEKGLDVQLTASGSLLVKDKEGEWQPAEETFLDSLWYNKFEIAGGIAGATIGVATGSLAAASTGGLGITASPMLVAGGSALGSGLGRVDDLNSLSDINKKVKEKLEVHKSLVANYKEMTEDGVELSDREREDYDNSLLALVGEQYVRNSNLNVPDKLSSFAEAFSEDIVLGSVIGKIGQVLGDAGIVKMAKKGLSSLPKMSSITRAGDFIFSKMFGDSIANNLARIYKKEASTGKELATELFDTFKEVNLQDKDVLNIFKETKNGVKLKNYLGTEGRKALSYLASLSKDVKFGSIIGDGRVNFSEERLKEANHLLVTKYLPSMVETLFALKGEADNLALVGDLDKSKLINLGSQKLLNIINAVKHNTQVTLKTATKEFNNTLEMVEPRKIFMSSGKQIKLPFEYSSVSVGELKKSFDSDKGASFEPIDKFVANLNSQSTDIFESLIDKKATYLKVNKQIRSLASNGAGNDDYLIVPTVYLEELGNVVKNSSDGVIGEKTVLNLNKLGKRVLEKDVYPELQRVTKAIKDSKFRAKVAEVKRDYLRAKAKSRETLGGFERIGLELRAVKGEKMQVRESLYSTLKTLTSLGVDKNYDVVKSSYDNIVRAIDSPALVTQLDGIILAGKIDNSFKDLFSKLGDKIDVSPNGSIENNLNTIIAHLNKAPNDSTGVADHIADFLNSVPMLNKTLDKSVLSSPLGRKVETSLNKYYRDTAPFVRLIKNTNKKWSEEQLEAGKSGSVVMSVKSPMVVWAIDKILKPLAYMAHSVTSRTPFIKDSLFSMPVTKLKLIKSLNSVLDTVDSVLGDTIPKASIKNLRKSISGQINEGQITAKTAYDAYSKLLPITKEADFHYTAMEIAGSHDLKIIPLENLPEGATYGDKGDFIALSNIETVDKDELLSYLSNDPELKTLLRSVDSNGERISLPSIAKELLSEGVYTGSEQAVKASKAIKSIIRLMENDTERYIVWDGVAYNTKKLLKPK